MPGPKNGRKTSNRTKVPKRKPAAHKKAPTCKYVLNGNTCHRGISCKYSHVLPEAPSAHRNNAPRREHPRRVRTNPRSHQVPRRNTPHRRPQRKYVKSKIFERVLGELRDNENTAQECNELTDLFQGWNSLGADPNFPKKGNLFSYEVDVDELAESLSALGTAGTTGIAGTTSPVILPSQGTASHSTGVPPFPAFTLSGFQTSPVVADIKEESKSLPELPVLPSPVIPKPTPQELSHLKENILKQAVDDYLCSDEPSLHWSLMWVSSSLNRKLLMQKRRSL